MHEFSIRNLSVEAKGKRVAEGISLTLRSGEIHVLMGQNGSGKSSLLNALFGHPSYTIEEGKILLDGIDITALPTEKKAKAGLFLSLQHVPEIAGVTLLNFLHRAHRVQKDSDISILDFNVEVGKKAQRFGIPKEMLRRQVNHGLSGGEKKQAETVQLVALAPKFAFLDEIDSGVDVDSLGKIFSAIESLKKEGTGFLLVTHYPDILDKITPDFVHVMKEGRIVRSGGREIAKEIGERGFS